MGEPGLQGLAAVVRMSDEHQVAVALHPGPGVTVPGLHLIHGTAFRRIHRLDDAAVLIGPQVNGLMQAAAVIIVPRRQHMQCQRPGKKHLYIGKSHNTPFSSRQFQRPERPSFPVVFRPFAATYRQPDTAAYCCEDCRYRTQQLCLSRSRKNKYSQG